MISKSLLAAAAIDGVLALAVVLAQAFPQASNGWQFGVIVAVLMLQAWGMWIQSQNNRVVQSKVDSVGDKAEVVHKALNSQLDAFKREAADQYKLALEQGIAIARAASQKDTDAKLAILESKISSLEAKLDSERMKAVALAVHDTRSGPLDVKVTGPDPLPVTNVPQSGEERLQTIREGGTS